MSIFDVFTGSGQARAQGAARDIYNKAYDTTVSLGNAQINTLQGGRDAAGTVLRGYENKARNDVTQGAQRARTAFGQMGDAYIPIENLRDEYGAGRETYIDALGLNGAEGLSRARSAFGNTLQSNFEMDQGLEAINRARAARGGGTVVGGNIDRDAQNYGQELANSRTNQYLDRLYGLTGMEYGAASQGAAGRAAAAGGLAALEQGTGANLANISQSTGNRIADLTMGTSRDVAGVQGKRIDYNNLRASQIANSILAERDARDQGSANLINFGVAGLNNVAKLAGGLFGGFGGFGGGGGMGVPMNKPV